MRYLFRILLILGLTVIGIQASAQKIRRISSVYKDLSSTQKVYLHAGLISVIEFPQNILEIRVGNTKTIKVDPSQISPKEITVQLLNEKSKPTNLIVKSEKKFYIFDIIPSSGTHQDYIKIRGAYGGPEFAENLKPSQSIKLGP